MLSGFEDDPDSNDNDGELGLADIGYWDDLTPLDNDDDHDPFSTAQFEEPG